MTSKATTYRKEHPEYYERERAIDRERVKQIIQIYQNNPEYREKVKQQASARYYRLKQEKLNTVLPVE